MTLTIETLAEAMHEGRSDIPWAATSQQDSAFRDARAVLTAIEQAGYVVVPREPSDGLLVSMAIRSDHALAVPGYYDGDMFPRTGTTHAQRLAFAKSNMAQLHEEVVGTGFYRPEKEADYATMPTAAPKIQHSEGEGR